MSKPLRFELEKSLSTETTRARAAKIYLKKHPYAQELTQSGFRFPNSTETEFVIET